MLSEDGCELALGVLHFVALIDDDILPVPLIELEPVLEDEVVGGDADIPLSAAHGFDGLGARVGVAFVDDLADGWRPLLELGHPV